MSVAPPEARLARSASRSERVGLVESALCREDLTDVERAIETLRVSPA